MRTFCLFILIITAVVSADIAVTGEARKALHLTVYRDFGVIRDCRAVNLPKGTNRIRFEGVATGIDASSVFVEWPKGKDLDLLSQSYEFDLISPTKLMEKYIGKELEIIPRRESLIDSTQRSAELLSVHGEEPVFRVGTKITYGHIGQILFPYVPDNLYTKPTLIWEFYSPDRQPVELSATYLTEGVSWRAGYVLHIDKTENTGLFSALITLDNQSGLDCKDATITFVAGNIKRVESVEPQVVKSSASDGDFYFYSINRPITLLTNQTKQIEWIPQVNIRFKQSYIVDFRSVSQSNSWEKHATLVLEAENSEQNNLGIPLPEGLVRIFKKDVQSNSRFVGEDIIEDTKSKSSFSINVGGVSEIIAKKIFQRSEPNKGDSFIIDIRNNTEKEIELKVIDSIGTSRLSSSSANYRYINDSMVEWTLKSGPRENRKISYVLQKN